MKRIAFVLLCLVLLLCGCGPGAEKTAVSVVATIFPAYDFARAAGGEEVSMLLPPGTELHSFEPTAEDIEKIKNADVLVYTGGEGDAWIDRVLSSIDTKDMQIVRMVDHSSLICDDHEEEGEHHGHIFDEHVWLSPDNAKSITLAVAKALGKADPAGAEKYLAKAKAYCAEITALAEQTTAVVTAAPHKTLAVADRFPLKYFCEYYSLDYEAAFDACDLLADADAKTVLRLIDTVKNDDLSAVFYIENGSGYLADTVCEETGAEKLIINSMHTVTPEAFSQGVTYLDIMRQNKAALERGLY